MSALRALAAAGVTGAIAAIAIVLSLGGLLGASGCGGRPPVPRRGVVEGDVGGWKFRRFQPVLDVEVWVADNKAEAFTASYVRDEAERRGRIEDRDVVSVFVTRYELDRGVLRETVKLARRLAQESGYVVDEGEVGGVRAVSITGHGEAWVMWAAGKHVVKVGGRGRDDVPSGVVEAYGERYPSVMPGSVLEGPLPPSGPASGPGGDASDSRDEGGEGGPKKPPKAPYDPKNPRPDWDGYDPKKPLPKPRQPAKDP
jgi:hypothetical protein